MHKYLGFSSCLVSVPVRAAADPVVVGQLEDGANGSKRVVLIVDHLVGGSLDVVSSDGVNSRKGLRGRHSAAVGEHLATNVLSDVGERVQLHEHGGLELGLGALHLLVGHIVAQTDHVVQGVPHSVVELVVGGNEVHAEETSVLVGGVEGGERVAQLVVREVGGESANTNVQNRIIR